MPISVRLTVVLVGEDGIYTDEDTLEGVTTYADVLEHIIQKHGARDWILNDKVAGRIDAAQLRQRITGSSIGLHGVEVLDRAAKGRRAAKKRFRVTPKPNSGEHDVKPLFQDGIKGGLEELGDNSLNALLAPENRARMPADWQPSIWMEFKDSRDDEKAMLIVRDNGVGMSEEIVRSYLKMTSSWSRIPDVQRSRERPIQIDKFINPALGRYGMGCNAVQGFGSHYTITTREVGSLFTYSVSADKDQWNDDYREGGDGWGADWDLGPDADSDDEGQAGSSLPADTGNPAPWHHGTEVSISRLRAEVLEELRDKAKIEKLRGELAQDYYFFVSGIPDCIRERVPADLQYVPVDTDLSIYVFGTRLHKTTLGRLPGAERPVLFRVLSKYEQICKAKPNNLPFLLYLRYVPKGLEELGDEWHEHLPEPDDETIVLREIAEDAQRLLKTGTLAEGKMPGPSKGKGAAKQKGGGKAAKADGKGATRGKERPPLGEAELRAPLKEHDPTARTPPTFVDLLLILFNFPLEEGLPSKPNAGMGVKNKEPFIYPFWSGRMMPKCELIGSLPKMVEMAATLGRSVSEAQAFKLDKSHLAGFLLLSPEGKPQNHKTDLHDVAYQVFKDLGPEPEVALGKTAEDAGDRQGAMHTYDFSAQEFKEDPDGAMATRMLLMHFRRYWKGQDDEGRLVNSIMDESPLHGGSHMDQSTQYKLASNAVIKDTIRQGELVSLVEAGPDPAPEASSSAAAKRPTKCYYVVDKFYQEGSDSQHQHKVSLFRWYPSWSKPELKEASLQLHSVLEMQPLSFGTHVERMKHKEKLVGEWEATKVPHHLAYFKREAGRAAKSRKQADKVDKVGGWKAMETTTHASEADGLGLASAAPRLFTQDTLFEQVEVGIAYQSGKLVSKNAPSSLKDQATDFGKRLMATLARDEEQVWTAEFLSFDSLYHVFRISGFKEHAARVGAYTLTMDVPNDVLQADALKLTLHFQVAAPVPSSLQLKFVDAEGVDVAHERARLGQPTSRLLLSLRDSKGNEACFPAMSPEQLRQSVELIVNTQQPDPTAASSKRDAQQQGRSWLPFLKKQQASSARLSLSEDRLTLAVGGYVVPGSSMGGSSLDAQLAVKLRLPTLDRTLQSHVALILIAGRPARIKVEMSKATAKIAKGERTCDGMLSLEDQWHNTYTHNLEGSQEKEVLDVQLTCNNVANERGRRLETEPLSKPQRVALSDTGFASLPSIVAMGCVGSRATVSVRVSDGHAFDLSLEAVNRPIFDVHLGFTHPLLDMQDQMAGHTGRRRAVAAVGQEQALDPKLAARFPGLARLFKLDLLDRVNKFQDAARRTAASQNKRLTLSAWSLQPDLLQGLEVRLDGSVIRPNGKRYTFQQRQRLVDDLNKLIDESKAVHEVACVVNPGLRELKGMGVQVCNADNDEKDYDWAAEIKMSLVTRDASGKQLQQHELPDLRYRIDKKVESMAFSVVLPEQLFEASPCAELLFSDCDNPQKVYGQLYLRQAPRPHRLLLLPIGQSFADASVRAPCSAHPGILKKPEAPAAAPRPSATGTDSAAGPSSAAAAADPYATLAGWKLVSEAQAASTVSFDNLEDMVALQAPGLAVRRARPFRVYFVCSDQYGVPIEVPHSLREALEGCAVVEASSVEDGAAGTHAGEGAEPEAASGAAALQSTSSCTRASIVQGSWRWESLPVPVQSPRPAWSMPCFSLELVVTAGSGAAKLRLQAPLPCGPGQQGQEQGFEVQVPVLVAAKSMRPDGYVVQSVGSASVKVRMASCVGQGSETVWTEEGEGAAARKRRRTEDSEDGDGGEETVVGGGVGEEEMNSEQGSTGVDTRTGAVAAEDGGEAGGQGADGPLAAAPTAVVCDVESPEDEEVSLEILLLDSDGHPLQQQGAVEFAVQAPDAPGLAAASRQVYAAGRLRLQFKVPRAGGIGEAAKAAAAADAAACAAGALALVGLELKPSSASLSHVLPLRIRLLVRPGLYAASLQLEACEAWPNRHFTWPLPGLAGSPDMERGLPRLQILAANGEPWQPSPPPAFGAAAAGSSIDLEWGTLPDGVDPEQPIDPEQLQQVLVRSNDPRLKAKASPLNFTSSGQGRKPRMRMPSQTGTWFLLASYPDGAGGSLYAQVARVDVEAGPACRLVKGDCQGAEGALRAHPLKTLVKRGGGGPEDAEGIDMPKIKGYLLDCHNNVVTVEEGHCYDTRLCVRRRGGEEMQQLHMATMSEGQREFMLVPQRTLLQVVEAAEKLPELEGGSSVAVLPEFDLVLLCNLRRPGERAAASSMEQLAGSCIGGEYPLATLIIVPADLDIQKLVEDKNDLEDKEAELEKKQQDLAAALAAAEAKAAAAAAALQSTLTSIENIGGNLDQVIAAKQAEGARAQRRIEDGRMEFLDTAEREGPRPRLLQPWFSARGGQPMHPDERFICERALELSRLDRGRVLGPVISLAAVERKKVAAALASLAGRSSMFYVIVQGDSALQAVNAFMSRHSGIEYDAIDLEDQNTASRFKAYPVVQGDPQLRLQLPCEARYRAALEGNAQHPPVNFVGYAVNLLRLPPALLGWSMASGRQSLNLRQSLLLYLFQEAMVFETKADMKEFRDRCRMLNLGVVRNCMVALDGTTYNKRPGLHSTRKPADLSFNWSSVPRAQQCGREVLDYMVGRAWAEGLSSDHEVACLQQLKDTAKRREEEKGAAEEEAAQLKEQTEREQASVEEELGTVRQQLEEVKLKLQQANSAEGEASEARTGPRGQGAEPGPSLDRRTTRTFGSKAGAKQKRGAEPAGRSPAAGRAEPGGSSERSTRQRRA